jgi:hypothetical protein
MKTNCCCNKVDSCGRSLKYEEECVNRHCERGVQYDKICHHKKETINHMNISIKGKCFSQALCVESLKDFTLYMNIKQDQMDGSTDDAIDVQAFISENVYSNCSYYYNNVSICEYITKENSTTKSCNIRIHNHSNYIFIFNNTIYPITIENLMIVGNSQCA